MAITIIILVIVPAFSLIVPVLASSSNIILSVEVTDSVGNAVDNATIYVIKNPLNDTSNELINETNIAAGQIINFSLDYGEYTVSAHKIDYGWATQTLKYNLRL